MELTSAEQVYHVTRICVDSYEKQVPTGWICNPYLEEAVPFHGVMQFLLRMEALLDQLNFPQSFTANRGMPDTLTTATPSHGMREGAVETSWTGRWRRPAASPPRPDRGNHHVTQAAEAAHSEY